VAAAASVAVGAAPVDALVGIVVGCVVFVVHALAHHGFLLSVDGSIHFELYR
jgi:hypothetical protein